MTTKANYLASHPNEFEQGRRARLSSVSKQDAPFDAGTDALKAWEAGFDAAEGEGARNGTSAPAETKAAEGQMATVADTNSKAKAKH